MAKLRLLAAIFGAAFADVGAPTAAGVAEESVVVELESGTFDQAVEGSKHALVFFYAPWCGHCQNLHPVFEEAAQTLKKDGVDVLMATVDATVHTG